MEQELEIKKENQHYRASLYYRSGKKRRVHYWNIIGSDKNKLAQVMLDLALQGIPIDEAFKIYRRKIDNKDWLGF